MFKAAWVGFSLHLIGGSSGWREGGSRVQSRELIGSSFGLVFRAIGRLGL